MHPRLPVVGRFLAALTLLAITILALLPLAQGVRAEGADSVDPVFGGSSLGLVGLVRTVTLQPDGKVLVGGNFRRGVVRLNADGTPDTGFLANVRSTNAFDSPAFIDAVAVQPDGKILVGGFFDEVNGVTRNYVARLNRDGSLDDGFKTSVSGASDTGFFQVQSLAVQPDGKILLGGEFDHVNGVEHLRIARLQADGSLDVGFNPGSDDDVLTVVVQPDGKILLGGRFDRINGVDRKSIARLNAEGTLDQGFNATVMPNPVSALAVQPDGKIVLGGDLLDANFVRNTVVRLNADGGVDQSFRATTSDDIFGDSLSVVVQPDGKIILSGNFTTVNGVERQNLVRLNADGTLDRAFNAGFSGGQASDGVTLAIQTDGKILLGGGFTQVNGAPRNSVARVNVDGSLDTGFAPDTASGPNAVVLSIALPAEGKVLIGGQFTQVSGIGRLGVARLNTDGTVDPGFNAVVTRDVNEAATVNTVVVQPDGRILLGGNFSHVNGEARGGLARLQADGTLDPSFNVTVADEFDIPGGVQVTTVQPDGKILIGGDFSQVNGVARGGIARLNPDGSIDGGFDVKVQHAEEDLSIVVSNVVLQPDGKILLGGVFDQVNGSAHLGVARLNPDGSLDSGFNAQTASFILALALQPDGRIVVGGAAVDFKVPSASSYLARLNADGTSDQGFNASLDGMEVISVAVQPDGKIVLGGLFDHVNRTERHNLARLNPNGSLDPAFNSGSGVDNYVYHVTLQPDGKVLLGGEFLSVDGVLRNHVARLVGDANRSTALVSVVGAGLGRGGFLLSRTGGNLASALTISYRVGEGAIAGTDYRPLDGTLTFAAGQSEAVVPVTLLPGANRQRKVKVFLDPGVNGAYDLGKAQSKVFLSELP